MDRAAAALAGAVPLLLVTIATVLVALVAVLAPAKRQRHLLHVLDRLTTFAAVVRTGRPLP
jgi:type IV secretory pathway component VirB8